MEGEWLADAGRPAAARHVPNWLHPEYVLPDDPVPDLALGREPEV